MEHVEALSKYVTHFVDQLAYSGVEHVVISPGSRSTPLAMAFAEYPAIKHWVHLDERSAAFFALGLAKAKREPVAIVCTSGTAAANYYPAIVEAHYSDIPLLVITADRPHELRDVGAPQAINQTNMFGPYVKWFQDMALPEGRLTSYVRKQAARATEESMSGKRGPVHLNFPFREPLIPDFSLKGLWREGEKPVKRAQAGFMRLTHEQILELLHTISGKKGVLVAGPGTDPSCAEVMSRVAVKLGVPLLADPLSGLRTGSHDKRNIVENYDAILKSDEIKQELKPDFILRFGAMPVSKAYLQWVQLHSDADHFVVSESNSFKEPSGVPTQFIWSNERELCQTLEPLLGEGSEENDYLNRWMNSNDQAKAIMLDDPQNLINEGHTVVHLQEVLPDQSILFTGNSMPIREVDSFFMSTPKEVEILANRGANGIDGVVSTAIGCAASGKPTTLLIGDVSLFHDLNGLWMARQYEIPLTIVLINNDGGGIFSYLPQSSHPKHFEELFGTPVGIDFHHTVHMYGGSFTTVQSWDEYKHALTQGYEKGGLHVIEIITSRDDHVDFHKAKWAEVRTTLLEEANHV